MFPLSKKTSAEIQSGSLPRHGSEKTCSSWAVFSHTWEMPPLHSSCRRVSLLGNPKSALKGFSSAPKNNGGICRLDLGRVSFPPVGCQSASCQPLRQQIWGAGYNGPTSGLNYEPRWVEQRVDCGPLSFSITHSGSDLLTLPQPPVIFLHTRSLIRSEGDFSW